MKKFTFILFNLLFCALLSPALATMYSPETVIVADAVFMTGVTVLTFVNVPVVPNSVFGSGVYVELWTGELIKKFVHTASWLSKIPQENRYVNNNVIHLVDVGADPAVLIDNTTYPIATAGRTDTDIPVALKRFETENTKVTNDELYAISYDKVASVVEQHKSTLEEVTAKYGLHSLAPASDGADTPVIVTTGADNGNGRKRLLVADIAALKLRLDNLNIPLVGRILVLCNDHINDLLAVDQSFRDRFVNTASGAPINFYGFEIFQDVYNPVYNISNVKKAFGAAAAGTDRNASIVMYTPRAFKAMGTVEMFYQDAKTNPTMRESVAGFRLYHIVLPKKNVGFGAVVSDDLV